MNSLGGVQSVVFLSIFSASLLSGGQLVAGATQSGQNGQNGKQNGNGSQPSSSRSSPTSSSSSSSGGSRGSTLRIPPITTFDDAASPALPVGGIGTGLVAQMPVVQRDEPRWDIQGTTARLVGTHRVTEDEYYQLPTSTFGTPKPLPGQRTAGARPTAAQFGLLIQALPAGIERLDLTDSGLTAEGMALLAVWFQAGNGSSIRALILAQNSIGEEGARTLAGLVAEGSLRQLEELSLHDTEMNSILVVGYSSVRRDGTEVLFDSMTPEALPSLRTLNLNNARISIVALTRVLRGNQLPLLQALYIEENSIGDTEEARSLLQALARTSTLTRLSLSNTWLGSEAMAVLVEAIANGGFERLQYFNLSLNRFNDADAVLLARALQDRPIPSLEELDIHNEVESQIYTWRNGIEMDLRSAFQGVQEGAVQGVAAQGLRLFGAALSGEQSTVPTQSSQNFQQRTEAARVAGSHFESAYNGLRAELEPRLGDFEDSFRVVPPSGLSFVDGLNLQHRGAPRPDLLSLIVAFRQAFSEIRPFSNAQPESARFYHPMLETALAKLEERYQGAERVAQAYSDLHAKNRNLRLKLPKACLAFEAKFR